MKISWRYPTVEMASCAIALLSVYYFGWSARGVCWFGFGAVLMALALIDWDTMILPDELTQGLLWSGLLLSSLGATGVALRDALWGAMAGYVSLWFVYWAFLFLRGKEAIGYGDFKLLAAIGAWIGWQPLAHVVLFASLLGLVMGIAPRVFNTPVRYGRYIPFGPALAVAGFLVGTFRESFAILGAAY